MWFLNKDKFSIHYKKSSFLSHFPECKLSRSGPPATIVAIDEESPNGKVFHPLRCQPVRVHPAGFNQMLNTVQRSGRLNTCGLVWATTSSLTLAVSHSLLSVLQDSGESGFFDIWGPLLGKFHDVTATKWDTKVTGSIPGRRLPVCCWLTWALRPV